MVDVIGHHVDDPSIILCSPACLCVCNDEDNLWACTKGTPRLKGRREWMLTRLIYFCEHYNVITLYFITNSYLLLNCLSVGFLCILGKKLIISILTHNPKNSIENVYIIVQKGPNCSNCTPTPKLGAGKWSYPLSVIIPSALISLMDYQEHDI